MRIHDFNELSGIDFHLTYFNVSTTLETPQRTYRCHKSLRPYDRFYYIDEGIFTITEDGYDTMTLTSGDLLYLPADCTYSSAWKSEEISYYSVIFSLAENRSGEKFSLSDRIEHILMDHSDVTSDLMRRIWTTRTRGGIASNMKSWSLFFELLQLATVEKVKVGLKTAHADISPAIIYLENNFTSDVNVSDLAKLCRMCDSRFRAEFLKYAGMSPIRYRNYLRAKKAAELLSDGEYTVSEAAELVGIPDTAYFSRVFRTFMGESPGNFARKGE